MRPQIEGTVGGDDLALQVVGLGGRSCAQQLHHALGRASHCDSAALLPAGGESGFFFKSCVQLRRILHQTSAGLRRTQLPHQAGGMPRGAGRELALLEQNNVGHTERSQVIRDRTADDAATDDYYLGAGGKIHDGRLVSRMQGGIEATPGS